MSDFIEALNEAISVNPSYKIILPILLGVFIAIIITYVNKAKYGKFLKAIRKIGADSEENAVKPEDLGVEVPGSILRQIDKGGYGVGKMVKKTEDGRLYMPVDMQVRSETVYGTKELHPVAGLLILLAFILLFVLLLRFFPMVMEFLETSVDALKEQFGTQ
ncbi:MAG: hypothetical protein KBT31_00380 [Firmicutes bacterium]|nr:hypothetical protein [Candidatus Colimorpha enterica]